MLARQNEFEGINNVDEALQKTKVTFAPDGSIALSGDLKACVNFRCRKDKKAVVRNGQTSKLAVNSGHSFWTNKAGTIALYVDGTTLKQLSTSYTASTLYSGLYSGARMCYIEHNNIIFMGNGHQMLKMKDGAVSVWGDTLSELSNTTSTNLTDDDMTIGEFEFPRLTYRTPPLSNILLSYRARVYVADGRFALYSKDGFPETFRSAHNIPCWEDITAMSADYGHIYLHTLNTTKVLTGLDPDDFIESEFNIGAIKHGTITPHTTPFILSKKGWAKCENGIVGYVDHDNFRLDLADTAEAHLGYDPINEEIIGVITE